MYKTILDLVVILDRQIIFTKMMSNNSEKKAVVYIYLSFLGSSISLFVKEEGITYLLDLKNLTTNSKKQLSTELTEILQTNKILDKDFEELEIVIHTISKILATQLYSIIQKDLNLIFSEDNYSLSTVKGEIDSNCLNGIYLLFISGLDDLEVKISNLHLAKRFKVLRSNYIADNYHTNPKIELYAILLGYRRIEGFDRKFLYGSAVYS